MESNLKVRARGKQRWYHSEYVRIMVIHRDFAEAIKCSFWKITLVGGSP
jgi:hypothetical protein